MKSKSILLVVFVAGLAAAAFLGGYLAQGGAPGPVPRKGVEPGGAEAPWTFENPLLEVEEGEWALYRVQGGSTMLLEVVGRDPATQAVQLRDQRRRAGDDAVTGSEVLTVGTNHFLWGFESAGAVVTRLAPDEIRVAGRTWQCLRVETTGRLMGAVTHWYSPEVPGLGLLKQVRTSDDPPTVNAELVSWSKGGRGE